jgi:crotonobetainyl-CoA:carnitine CoA-transferase CaiB-like acyl-CoA transferase
MQVFGGRVPAAPVLDIAQALESPFVAERGGVAAFTGSSHGGEVRMVASPIRVPGEEIPTRAAPALGADTDAVLAGLGLKPADIESLRARGVV